MGQRFKSKIDAWLVIPLLAPAAIIFMASGGASNGTVHLTAAGLALLAVPLVVGAALPLWLYLSTSYTVGPENLTVRCGPVTRAVPLRSITRVAAVRSIESAPALSLDRLVIEYGARQHVVISPKNKPRFLEALAQGGVAVNLTLLAMKPAT